MIRNLSYLFSLISFFGISLAAASSPGGTSSLQFSCDFFKGARESDHPSIVSCQATGLIGTQPQLDFSWTFGKGLKVVCGGNGDETDDITLFRGNLIFALFPKKNIQTGPFNLVVAGNTTIAPKIDVENVNLAEIDDDTRPATLEYFEQGEKRSIYGSCQFQTLVNSRQMMKAATPNSVSARPL